MFGHIPKGKRGRANTTLLNAWAKHLNKLLQLKEQLKREHAVAKTSGLLGFFNTKMKNEFNNKHAANLAKVNSEIRKATAAVNHHRTSRYGK
jgi:hypothetical protein